MNIGEYGYFISKYLVYVFILVTSIYGFYAIYYAYFKSKDEREKFIVMWSITKAFSIALIIFFVYYILQISVKVANVNELTNLWILLHFNIGGNFTAGTALSTMMSLLGICFFMDTWKVDKNE